MMPHELQTDSRRVLEQWAFQQIRNEVWETVRDHDPGTLPEPTIQMIEQDVLAVANDLVLTLSVERLRDVRYMNIMIGNAISDAKDRLRKAAARRQWRA